MASGLRGVTTIGVNDIDRLFTPTYLVVVNPPGQFRSDGFQYVRESKPQALFTQLGRCTCHAPVRLERQMVFAHSILFCFLPGE